MYFNNGFSGTSTSTLQKLLPAAAVFGVGVMFGVGIGLLVAQKPGRELREELRERLPGPSRRSSDLAEA